MVCQKWADPNCSAQFLYLQSLEVGKDSSVQTAHELLCHPIGDPNCLFLSPFLSFSNNLAFPF